MTRAANPYVGPRSLRTGEALHGRDRELERLFDLLLAERIVLLYSPSGAGKSSLLQAGLVPRLRAEGFLVRPTVRVGTPPPAGVPADTNRFVLSALLSLSEDVPKDRLTSLDALSRCTLPEYLAQRRAHEAADAEVILFDQFEEALTVEATATAARQALFAQLGAVLRDDRVWAVLAMREDFIAGLDPFRARIPGKLRATFRLDLLGPEAALAAIQAPARAGGAAFRDDAARRLVDDLRQVRVPRVDGGVDVETGPHVEPVQLQVVCHGLWDQLPPDRTEIAAADVERLGDVDAALARYHDVQVAAAAARSGVPERALRQWLGRHLVTPQGLRTQVLQTPEATLGLANAALWALVDGHLLRSDTRRGMTWFELAHDRIVAPMQRSNAAWLAANVHPAQRQAELWQRAGRPELLLLATLAEAEALLAAADGWTADERAFLEHSAAARRREAAARRSQRLVAGLAALVVVLGIAGLAGGLLYFRQARAYAQERLRASEREAAEQQREATAALRGQLTSQVVQHREAQASLAARLAVAAASLAPSPWDRKEPLLAATVGAPQLVDVLTPPPPPAGFGDAAERSTSRTLGGRRGYLRLTAGDPGELLALGRQGKIFRWTPAGRRVTALLPHGPAAEAFARHPTRPLLAVGWSVSTPEARGTYARLWDFERGAWASEPLLPAVDDGDRTLLSLEFSADGARLAALYEEPGDAPQCVGVVIEVATGTVLRSVEDEPSVRAMALSPDGGTLILGRWDGAIAARDVASGARTELKSPLLTADRAVSVIRYSRDGRRLFAGGGDRYAALWSVPPVPGADQVLAVRPGSDIVDALLLSDTLVVLACSGSCRDAELSLWRTESLDPIGTPVTLPGRTLTTIAGLGDGRIAAGGEDHSIYVVDPRLLRAQREHEAWPQDDGYLADVPVVAARPDAPAVAVAEADAQGVGSELRLVDAATGQASPLLRSPARVVALGFSRDAARLVVVDRGGQVQAVALPGGEVRPLGRVPWGEVPLALAFADDGTAVIAAATPQGGALAREGDGFAPATLGPARPAAAVALDAGARVLAVSTCAATASEGDCDLGAVQLYDVAAGSPRGEPMHGHAGAARALALSADGRRLASGGGEGQVLVSDVEARSVIAFPARPGLRGVDDLAFTRDGEVVAATVHVESRAGAEIVLYRIATGDELASPLHLHSPYVRDAGTGARRGIRFADDDQVLVSAGADGVILWDVRDATLERRACELAARGFDDDERRRFFAGRPGGFCGER